MYPAAYVYSYSSFLEEICRIEQVMPHVKKSLIALSCLEFFFVCPGHSLAKVARFARNYRRNRKTIPVTQITESGDLENLGENDDESVPVKIFGESDWRDEERPTQHAR